MCVEEALNINQGVALKAWKLGQWINAQKLGYDVFNHHPNVCHHPNVVLQRERCQVCVLCLSGALVFEDVCKCEEACVCVLSVV